MNTLAHNFGSPEGTVQPLGQHVIAEFYGATLLEDLRNGSEALCEAARAVGATVLKTEGHDFGDRAGYTAVALLAESHVSIHTWPEHGYAALDIFMCGPVDMNRALKILKERFQPDTANITILKRGLPPLLPKDHKADAACAP
ncbi:MAG: adenosylmethionine decarboxylase [Pseudomonadota bacterium]